MMTAATLLLSVAFVLLNPSHAFNPEGRSLVKADHFSLVILTMGVQQPPDNAIPPDVVSDVSFEQDKPRLDIYADNLKKDEDAKLYVYVYGGRVGRKGEAKERAKYISDYLTKQRRIDATRMVVKDGGYRERMTVEIFYRSKKQPAPSPNPTVSFRDVRFIKRVKGNIKPRN